MLAQIGGYGGPSILTRGQAPSTQSGEAMIAFRPYVAVNGIYDSALTGVTTNAEGLATSTDAFGMEAQIGAYGYRGWKKTLVGLDYRGNYRNYTSNTYYNGTDQMLTLGISRQATRHVQIVLRNMGGTFSRGYGMYNGAGFLDPSSMQVPNNELFDNRVYYLTTAADVIYQKSTRLSFSGGGDGFLARRRSASLFGVSGYGGRGEIEYRLSRFSTLGVDYRFTHFEFTKAFGSSDLHSVGLNYAIRPSRRWELAFRLGGSRLESLFLDKLAVDPVIAALTGIHWGIRASYRVRYMPDFSARLNRSFRHASLNFNYARQISPGNGIYLISSGETANISYSYTGVRKWNFGASGGYYKLRPVMQTMSNYKSYYGGVGATRQLKRSFHFIARFDARYYQIPGSTVNWNPYRATVGFAYSPGDIPLSLW